MPDAPRKPAEPPKKSRSPWVWAAVAAGVLAAVGVVAYAKRPRGTPAPVLTRDSEADALAALEVYEPKPEVDENGRVIRLKLEGRHVDDAALDHVVMFPLLRNLSLRDASVSDAGIEKLRGMKRLEALGITDTHVTDKGLAVLASIPSLRNTWVCTNPNLTDAGVQKLKKALPGLNVHVMNPPKPAAKATAAATKK